MFELMLLAPQDCVDDAGDALMEDWEALSVSVEDADADSDAEQALYGEPGLPAPAPGWQRSILRVLFAQEAQAVRAATGLLAQSWAQGIRVQTIQAVPDQDWVRLTQSQFDPVAITPDFWIVPSWHEPPAQALHVIRLDPGLAFGTGTHPTTRMCLRWTAQHAPARAGGWSRVLDYGCGSGILAIGAVLHGARHVDAVDIDDAAVQSSRANATANGVAGAGGVPGTRPGRVPAGVRQYPGHPAQAAGAGAVRPRPGRRRPGACRHLSRQAHELQQAYAAWLSLEVADEQEGWILMTGRRPA